MYVCMYCLCLSVLFGSFFVSLTDHSHKHHILSFHKLLSNARLGLRRLCSCCCCDDDNDMMHCLYWFIIHFSSLLLRLRQKTSRPTCRYAIQPMHSIHSIHAKLGSVFSAQAAALDSAPHPALNAATLYKSVGRGILLYCSVFYCTVLYWLHWMMILESILYERALIKQSLGHRRIRESSCWPCFTYSCMWYNMM